MKQHVVVRCDNQAVVQLLSAGRARDAFLAAFARNIWQIAAVQDIALTYVHILGKNNQVADLLSRWQYSEKNMFNVLQHVPNHVWVAVSLDTLTFDNDI